jgi:hypothetical protein
MGFPEAGHRFDPQKLSQFWLLSFGFLRDSSLLRVPDQWFRMIRKFWILGGPGPIPEDRKLVVPQASKNHLAKMHRYFDV